MGFQKHWIWKWAARRCHKSHVSAAGQEEEVGLFFFPLEKTAQEEEREVYFRKKQHSQQQLPDVTCKSMAVSGLRVPEGVENMSLAHQNQSRMAGGELNVPPTNISAIIVQMSSILTSLQQLLPAVSQSSCHKSVSLDSPKKFPEIFSLFHQVEIFLEAFHNFGDFGWFAYDQGFHQKLSIHSP